jgi:hypothetical protein
VVTKKQVGRRVVVILLIMIVSGAGWYASAKKSKQPTDTPTRGARSGTPTPNNSVPAGWKRAEAPINNLSFITPDGWTIKTQDSGNVAFVARSPDYQPQPNGKPLGSILSVSRIAKQDFGGSKMFKTAEELKTLIDNKSIPAQSTATLMTISGKPGVYYVCGTYPISYHCYVTITDTDYVVVSAEPATPENKATTQTFVDHLVIQ